MRARRVRDVGERWVAGSRQRATLGSGDEIVDVVVRAAGGRINDLATTWEAIQERRVYCQRNDRSDNDGIVLK